MKRIGLAVIAALALSAFAGVTQASALQLLSEQSSTVVKGSGSEFWGFGANSASCGSSPEGELVGLANTEFSPTVKDSECSGNTGTTRKMNGCKFTFRPDRYAAGLSGTVEIGPAGCGPITFESGGTLKCQISVPPQTFPVLTASYSTVSNVFGTGKSGIEVTASGSGITYTAVKGGYCGSLGTFNNGTVSGDWTLTGTSAGKAASISVGVNPLSICSKTLCAGSFPAKIYAKQNPKSQHVIATTYGNVSCTTANLNTDGANAVKSPGTGAWTAQPEYAGCKAFGFTGSVKTNECSYTLAAYDGHLSVACPAGKQLEIIAEAAGLVRCTMKIPAQATEAGGLTFTNEADSTINLGLGIKDLDYTLVKGTGAGACPSGSFTNGAYTGSSKLVGSY